MHKIIGKINRLLHNPEKIPMNIMYRLPFIFNYFSDEMYLKILYFFTFRKRLNIAKPETFNEKLQWLKLYDRKDKYIEMVDKSKAKKYVSDIIGEKYIIPTIGIYDRFDDIDFDILPNQFVIKCTHDSGNVVICKNKKNFNIKNARKKINNSLKKNYYYVSREWPYKNVKPRIIVEKYMEDINDSDLIDYKFYCFNGEPKYLYVSQGLSDHETAKIDFFDMNFKKAPFGRKDFKHYDVLPKKPLNFEKMKKLAKKLSNNMPFIRVDFYEINNNIYFSELTFTPCGGFMIFIPNEWDKKLGDLISLNVIK